MRCSGDFARVGKEADFSRSRCAALLLLQGSTFVEKRSDAQKMLRFSAGQFCRLTPLALSALGFAPL